MTDVDKEKTHKVECKNDDAHAECKYKQYRVRDPFPDIPPGLLRSTDIKKYVDATGMIHPFHTEPKNKHMKQASYAVKVLGRCIYWDEKEKKHDELIEEKKEFVLKKNSIAFISLEPRFRIPYYIALRFNLKITHIHRGILLGTGPLVDPGFDGKLLVPLHNLTMNDYVIRGGDDLIWFEFTKLAPSEIENIAEFRPDKNMIDPDDYLHKAFNGHPIASSLSDIRWISEKAMRRTKTIAWGGLIGAGIALLALLVGIIYPTWTLINDSTDYIKGAMDSNRTINDAQIARIQALEKELDSLKSKIQIIEQRSIDKQADYNPSQNATKKVPKPGK